MIIVKEWASNLFIIIIALSFIEILLPDTSTAKYIKYVFSLIIMATILYPIIELLSEYWGEQMYTLKENGVKVIALLIIVGVILLSVDVFTTNKDGRRQIVDNDGGTEAELISILGDIKDVGAVDVMVQHNDSDEITGVVVTAEGASNPVVKNNIVNAVMALFNLSASNVEVFEKSQTDMNSED